MYPVPALHQSLKITRFPPHETFLQNVYISTCYSFIMRNTTTKKDLQTSHIHPKLDDGDRALKALLIYKLNNNYSVKILTILYVPMSYRLPDYLITRLSFKAQLICVCVC